MIIILNGYTLYKRTMKREHWYGTVMGNNYCNDINYYYSYITRLWPTIADAQSFDILQSIDGAYFYMMHVYI